MRILYVPEYITECGFCGAQLIFNKGDMKKTGNSDYIVECPCCHLKILVQGLDEKCRYIKLKPAPLTK